MKLHDRTLAKLFRFKRDQILQELFWSLLADDSHPKFFADVSLKLEFNLLNIILLLNEFHRNEVGNDSEISCFQEIFLAT